MVKLNRYYRLLDFCNNFVYSTNIVCTLLYCLLLIMVELEERMGEMCWKIFSRHSNFWLTKYFKLNTRRERNRKRKELSQSHHPLLSWCTWHMPHCRVSNWIVSLETVTAGMVTTAHSRTCTVGPPATCNSKENPLRSKMTYRGRVKRHKFSLWTCTGVSLCIPGSGE